MPNVTAALKATTQEHLDIYTIKDHLIVLKDGSVALVLQASAINFGLLSEEEQDATIYAYGATINSLSFPIQILIRSSKKDITSYVDLLDQQVQKTRSQKIKEQLVKYRQFVKNLVKNNKVLEKKFYIVVPFGTVEVGTTMNQLNPFTKEPQKPGYDLDYIIEKSKLQLYPRRDHLIRQFARLGLQIKQLNTQDLVNLFYNIYNPSEYASSPLTGSEEDFQAGSTQSAPATRAAIEKEESPMPKAPEVEVSAPGAIAHEQQPAQTPAPSVQNQPQPPASQSEAQPQAPLSTPAPVSPQIAPNPQMPASSTPTPQPQTPTMPNPTPDSTTPSISPTPLQTPPTPQPPAQDTPPSPISPLSSPPSPTPTQVNPTPMTSIQPTPTPPQNPNPLS